jgi:hypothetical protein
MIRSVPKNSEPLITLVVRRGALRRFHKLQKETADLPVIVTWDRRTGGQPDEQAGAEGPPDDRRGQQSFTWDLADFIVVPGEPLDTPSGAGETDPDAKE